MKERLEHLLKNLLENHKKSLLISMVLVLLICLIVVIFQFFRPPEQVNKPIKRQKATTEKLGKTTQTTYSEAVNVNELYQKSKAIMQKEKLTKEDYDYLKMADSTLKSITITR